VVRAKLSPVAFSIHPSSLSDHQDIGYVCLLELRLVDGHPMKLLPAEQIDVLFSPFFMGEDRRRFEEIFLPFLDAAYNLARWIVRHDQDAQDIVQEAYLRAFKGYPRFKGGNARAWLLTIVRNTAYTWINRQAADRKLVPYEEEKHAEIISFNQAGDESMREKKREYLQSAMERLPTEFREIIILYEYEGLSYKELALALGLPVGTVMSRLSRARRRLQQEFVQLQGSDVANEL
jgi:RNA polymerase sigma-70 factor (ECF subfamily)